MKTPYRIAAVVLLGGIAAANGNGNGSEDEEAKTSAKPTAAEALFDMSETGEVLGASDSGVKEPGGSNFLGGINTTLIDNEDITLKVVGRVFWDVAFFSADDPPYSDANGATEFRTARIGVQGKLFDSIGYKAEYDFAGGDADFKDVYFSFSTGLGTVLIGHLKEPFSLEEATSSRFISFMERSLPVLAFSPSRSAGALLSDANEAQDLYWGVGVFAPNTDAFGDSAGGESAITGRLTHAPILEDSNGSYNVLHFGASGSYRNIDEVDIDSRPEAHLQNKIVSTGVLPADDAILAGVEAAWVGGPASLQSEYLYYSVSGAQGSMDADYMGWYVEGSYFFTAGDHRNYEGKRGRFNRVKPMENYGGGGTGALQGTLRYSMVDLADGPTDQEVSNFAVGLNWYLNPNTRVMLNYINSSDENTGVDSDGDFLMFRFQVDF